MKPRLHLVTSVPESLALLLHGQPRFLARHFDVTLITSPGDLVDRVREQEGLPVVTIDMARQITPGRDSGSLARLARFFRRTRPDLVQTYTPKAGLLGMLAARVARVPRRVHGIVGMPLMEATGTRRSILSVTERLTYRCATELTCNSYGLRDWIHTHLTQRPIEVVGHGSINGVDCERFSPNQLGPLREKTRSELALSPDATAFLFIGRMVRDKGMVELMNAFQAVHREHPETYLIAVGYQEDLDPLPQPTRDLLESHPAVIRTGFVSDVRPYLAAADVFVLPSYREGLPNCLLEAGAAGLPAVTTDINGCNEVVEDGMTGLLVPAKDTAMLADAMRQMVSEPSVRDRMGVAARLSVLRRYEQGVLWNALLAYYERLFAGSP